MLDDREFLKSLAELVKIGVMVERERCAKVVENMGRSNGRVLALHKRIAAEIRSGRERIGTVEQRTESC